jgi:hypothetical protein
VLAAVVLCLYTQRLNYVLVVHVNQIIKFGYNCRSEVTVHMHIRLLTPQHADYYCCAILYMYTCHVSGAIHVERGVGYVFMGEKEVEIAFQQLNHKLQVVAVSKESFTGCMLLH